MVGAGLTPGLCKDLISSYLREFGGNEQDSHPSDNPRTLFWSVMILSTGICNRRGPAASQAEETCSGQQTLLPCRAELIPPVFLSIARSFLQDRALLKYFLSAWMLSAARGGSVNDTSCSPSTAQTLSPTKGDNRAFTSLAQPKGGSGLFPTSAITAAASGHGHIPTLAVLGSQLCRAGRISLPVFKALTCTMLNLSSSHSLCPLLLSGFP